MTLYNFDDKNLSDLLYWFNLPKSYSLDDGLKVVTKKDTDFWQRTHYGFRRDDGHCLLQDIEGDFTLTTKVTFDPKVQYDQAGLIIRSNSENWIKCSTEYESSEFSRIGSVVTKDGYSDWATNNISSDIKTIYYKIEKLKDTVSIFYSTNGDNWVQIRISHFDINQLAIGLYICSPQSENFEAKFHYLKINKS